MPNPQPIPSQNAYFSPQTAFYASSSQQQMPSNQVMPDMEFLANNPLLNFGLNTAKQRMEDFTSETVKILPNEVKK